MAIALRKLKIESFQPWQFEALRLWVSTYPLDAIAEAVHQPLAAVRRLFRSAAGQRLIRQMHDGTLETVRKMQIELQAGAPAALDRIRAEIADPTNGMIGHRAAVWWLEAAGHTPLRRLEIRHQYENDDLESLTFEELRQRALESITGQPKMIETTAISVPDEK